MERATWIDWRQGLPESAAERVYLGEETCQERLPSPQEMTELARRVAGAGKSLSLVMPLLSERGLAAALRLVEAATAVSPGVEVVCSDWGLLHRLAELRLAEPVLGRMLAGQHTDPRIARQFDAQWQARHVRPIEHLDGTVAMLRHRPPGPALSHHLRSCAADQPDVTAFLAQLGVRRCELSNAAQGVELSTDGGMAWSLHVPEVLVSVTRWCPAEGEDMNGPAPCHAGRPCPADAQWRPASGSPLHRRANALYYRNDRLPANLNRLPITRLVERRHRP